MKYQLNGEPTAKAATPVAKPYDFAAAAEALAESLEHTRDAYGEYAAAEGRVLEVERVLEDLSSAVGSISKYGITVQNMALLNSDNCLDKALGLENLAIESLESLSESTKAMLQKQYCAGLENKATEMFTAMVARVKDFFVKLITWLREFFSSNARVVKMVNEIDYGDVNWSSDKKVNILSAADVKSAIEAMNKCLKAAEDTSNGAYAKVEIAKDAVAPTFEKKSGTLKELGWTLGEMNTIVTSFKTAAKPEAMNAAWGKIQQEYKEIIRQSGGTEAKEKLLAGFTAWRQAAKVTSAYGKLLKQAGFSILAVANVKKAASAPAAPAK